MKFLNISDYNQEDIDQINLTGGASVATSIKNFLSNVSSKKSSSLEKNENNFENSLSSKNNDISDKPNSSKNSFLSVFTLNSKNQESESDKPDSDKPDSDKPDSDKLESDKLESDKLESDKPESDKLESDKLESDKLESDKPDLESEMLSNSSNTLLDKSSSSKTMFETTNYENLSTINSLLVYINSVNNVDKNKNIIDHLSQFLLNQII